MLRDGDLRNSSLGAVSINSLNGMIDVEIQCALADQSIFKVYILIGKKDSRHSHFQIFFLIFEVPALCSAIC